MEATATEMTPNQPNAGTLLATDAGASAKNTKTVLFSTNRILLNKRAVFNTILSSQNENTSF